ncbi:hypothetical protein SAMN05428969_2010 [Devosia sp. YR412]|uniref:AbrB family transcriptional regulator n=1 Tax=Devosia sp. YR412 TaxID=1881030 RepID=UPI0008ABC530|nr:AbrB family transcriptional regulator [Devosia sp. YR412]SEQ10883.1 hypothetical protein SAMN05428969_2010 [Devosia sp. YR412]
MRSGWVAFAKVLLSLTIGAAGGILLSYFHLPLAWMLGAMLATAIAAVTRLPIAAPARLRPAMKGIVGTMLGASLSLELIRGAVGWWLPLTGLLVTSVIGTVVAYTILRRVARLDQVTAYFSALPGGLLEMSLIGEEKGGDQKAIALVHTVRVFSVVMLLPLLLQFFIGYDRSSRDTSGGGLGMIDSNSVAWFLGCLIVGMAIGRGLRLPSGPMLGPLLLSGGAHLLGLTTFVIPDALIAAAQVVLGVNVGARFIGADLRVLARIGATSFLTLIGHLVLAVSTAAVVAAVSDYDLVTLVLAYSPGGLTEMSLIAIALGSNVGFVALHHLARVLGVLMIGPALFGTITRRRLDGPPYSTS